MARGEEESRAGGKIEQVRELWDTFKEVVHMPRLEEAVILS